MAYDGLMQEQRNGLGCWDPPLKKSRTKCNSVKRIAANEVLGEGGEGGARGVQRRVFCCSVSVGGW